MRDEDDQDGNAADAVEPSNLTQASVGRFRAAQTRRLPPHPGAACFPIGSAPTMIDAALPTIADNGEAIKVYSAGVVAARC